MLTKVFKSGNSLAVRIPRKLWPASLGTTVELFREGDHLVLRPAEGSLAAVLDVFQEFDASYMGDGREVPDENEKEW